MVITVKLHGQKIGMVDDFEDCPFLRVSMAKGQQPVVTIFWGDNLIHINLFDAKFLWLVAVYFVV